VALVYTRPDDLSDEELRAALLDAWGLRATAVEYQAVGFGAHHWLATVADGRQFFVTVDDLDTRLRGADDSTNAAFGRLARSLETSLSLRRDAGLDFVVAPVLAAGGRVLVRLTTRYSVALHPFLGDAQPGHAGPFESAADRIAVVDLVARVHGAQAAAPPADDFVVPRRSELLAAMSQTAGPWATGPYGTRARDLLAAQAAPLGALLAAYDELAAKVAARPDRMVITHGEPTASNVLKTPAGFVVVDWESVLLAPPERDLWDLAGSDASIPAAYEAVTGTAIDQDALTLYRLWYDLFEIAGYVSLFRAPHGDTADAAESWRNLQHFLRPAERWPGLLAASAR
jgi:Phosphotransferase enzyme family